MDWHQPSCVWLQKPHLYAINIFYTARQTNGDKWPRKLHFADDITIVWCLVERRKQNNFRRTSQHWLECEPLRCSLLKRIISCCGRNHVSAWDSQCHDWRIIFPILDTQTTKIYYAWDTWMKFLVFSICSTAMAVKIEFAISSHFGP